MVIIHLFRCFNNSDPLVWSVCPAISGLDPCLKPGQIIPLGEIHGTEECPGHVQEMVCNALKQDLSLSVGLELQTYFPAI